MSAAPKSSEASQNAAPFGAPGPPIAQFTVSASTVPIRVDVGVDIDAHVETDRKLSRQVGRAVVQIRGIHELSVAEDGAALVRAVGVALFANRGLTALPLGRLAVDLAARIRRRSARAIARGDALRLALDRLIVVVAAVLAPTVAGLRTCVATARGVSRVRALHVAVCKASVATDLPGARGVRHRALFHANGRAAFGTFRGRRGGTVRFARGVEAGGAGLLDGNDLTVLFALLVSPELARCVSRS